MKSIIIPTRNRPNLLSDLIKTILPLLSGEDEVIVVDSSDLDLLSSNLEKIPRIKFKTSHIQSAAVQRNIGLNEIGSTNYVFFLDDDVVPDSDYFTNCIQALKISGAIGVSGLALKSSQINLRPRPSGFAGLFRRIFLLDSKKDGTILRSGISIPIRDSERRILEVDWLIGCSGWVAEKIGQNRFESDFLGQSLSEDVIFSMRMKKRGRLVTDSSIILHHHESGINRPSKEEFWRMWIVNRYRLIQVAEFGIPGVFCYWWANLGQFLILFFLKFIRNNQNSGSVKGLISGALLVIGFRK